MQQIPVRIVPNTTAVGGKIHVKLTEGKFQNIRRLITGPLILLYFSLAWVQINGLPWLLFDFSGHRIILFGNNLAWHDLPIMASVMITGTCLLFFAAVGWGRVWCGFACPQSVWTWLFIRIESLVEGRAAKRKRDEKKSMTVQLFGRRIIKHSLWLFVSFSTAVTFSGYFIPIRELLMDLASLNAGYFLVGWLITMTLLTYFNAGLVREKVCLHMCPYARFQGVMFDENTRTVTYDHSRGEPRRKGHKQAKDDANESSKGDCVDCLICVQVCPTGIDIRDGLQYECIDCAACIDACDAVMEKVGKPTGLISFQSENQIARKKSPLIRPRLLGYASVMLITMAATVYGFGNRADLVLDVLRDRNSLSHQNSQGETCNSYTIKLSAVSPDIKQVQLAVHTNNTLYLVGQNKINLTKGDYAGVYQLCNQSSQQLRRADIRFIATSEIGETSKEAVFLTQSN